MSANELIQLFASVTRLLGKEIDTTKVQIIDRGVPHQPQKLPTNKMGIYIFIYEGRILKIGKVGINSGPRFTSQHYNPNSSKSNLAKSMLSDSTFTPYVNKSNIKEWIVNNVRRIDIIMDNDLNIFALNLFEACLHYKYSPKYEGYRSQKFYGAKMEDII